MTAPLILFGAFDRHNLGDLLFPHVVGNLLGDVEVRCAGLVERDLTACGGQQVAALATVAAGWGERPANLVHVGGELLGCDAWQAGVMLLPPAQVPGVIAAYDKDEATRAEWAAAYLGNSRRVPYLAAKALFRRPGAFVYNSVGGVDWASRPAAFRAEVVERLRESDYLAVRDEVTWESLAHAGIAAHLAPDCVIMLAELFGERIARHAAGGGVAQMRAAFPEGYVAIQFSADFGDDATLSLIAGQLDQFCEESGLGLVFFRAGAAPWHDDAVCYEALTRCLRRAPVRIFRSLNIWDICALLAFAKVYCGSSLHGRIVAMSYGVPRLNLLHPDQVKAGGPTKQGAYAATWDAASPGVVAPAELAEGMAAALRVPRRELASTAAGQRALYRHHFAAWRKLLAKPLG